jgi:hypothetical protein
MQKRTEKSTVTIPVPDHYELRVGTLTSIVRQSGLLRSLFEAWQVAEKLEWAAQRLKAVLETRHSQYA